MAHSRIVNFAEIADPEWTFLKDVIQTKDATWSFYSARPKYWLEQIIKRPNLARIRASIQTGLRARGGAADLIISHLPRATLWSALFAALFRTQARHLAFSFNFTDLPTGLTMKLMRYAFRSVDRFVVFSESERHLYAAYFALDIGKFDAIPWCMNKPKTVDLFGKLPPKFICAVGGEGRDYRSLAMAAQTLPDVPIVVVVRPNSLAGIQLPKNFIVFTDIKNEEFWGVVEKASFVVLPLNDSNTNCGHISIVGSQIFGKPVVSTYSSGTAEYLCHGHNALLSAAGDCDALAENIQKLWSDEGLYAKLAACISHDSEKYCIDNWAKYLDSYLHQLMMHSTTKS